jgi:hypothetical protein
MGRSPGFSRHIRLEPGQAPSPLCARDRESGRKGSVILVDEVCELAVWSSSLRIDRSALQMGLGPFAFVLISRMLTFHVRQNCADNHTGRRGKASARNGQAVFENHPHEAHRIRERTSQVSIPAWALVDN